MSIKALDAFCATVMMTTTVLPAYSFAQIAAGSGEREETSTEQEVGAFADGDYSATGTYGNGPSQITVGLTVAAGIV